MAAVLDTNVLIYAIDPSAPQHERSRALLDRSRVQGADLCLTSQILGEFYAFSTDPRRGGRFPTDVLNQINLLIARPGIILLPTPPDLTSRWLQLVAAQPVRGAQVFDVQIVATMLAVGVTQVYTYNAADFSPYAQVQVLTP